jgi:hypothetical protein
MSNELTTMLVGQHFNPPATVILKCLRNGTKVQLVPEPTNPYDEGAIEVRLVPGQIDRGRLESFAEDLAGHGSSFEEIDVLDTAEWRSEGEWLRLGHVAANGGKPFAKAKTRHVGLVGTKELAGVVPCEGRLEWVGEDVMIKVRQLS